MQYQPVQGTMGTYHSILLGRGGARILIVGHSQITDPNRLIADFQSAVSSEFFAWGRSIPSDLDVQTEKGWKVLVGVNTIDNHSNITKFAIITTFPSRMSFLGAFDQIDRDENLRIVPSFWVMLLCAERALATHEAGLTPEFLFTIAPRLAAEILTGVSFLQPDIPRNENSPGPEIPDLLSGDEIKALARNVPLEMYQKNPDLKLHPVKSSDSLISGSRPNQIAGNTMGCYSYEVIAMMLPGVAQKRSLDIARWLLAYGDYLWSQEFFTSQQARLFSSETDSVVTTIIEEASELAQFFRGWEFDYKGQKVSVPFSPKKLRESGLTQDIIDSTFRIWLQLVELYTTDAPVEVLQALNPGEQIHNIYLGVDSVFNPDENIEQLKILARELQEKTRKERVYTPMGAFWYDLPQELTEVLDNINVLGILPYRTTLDVKTIHLYVDGLKGRMWARLYGDRGAGPIFGWEPGRKIHDNMLSVPFAVIMDFVLSAIWRDLCCAGEKSFPKHGEQAIPPQAQLAAKRIRQAEGGGRKRHRSSRQDTVRVLPSVPSMKDMLPLSGQHAWSTAEERERIKMVVHQVKGYPRRLPEGQKRSAEKDQQIWELGIILPADKTYVNPFARGSRQPNDPADRRDPQIVSKGLATLITFFSTVRTVPVADETEITEKENE